jgi:hypothetical protein
MNKIIKNTQSNLYDSIINEVEKICRYENEFNKLTNEELKMIEEHKRDIDLVNFIFIKKDEILTDKLLRTFVNFKVIIDRFFRLSISTISDIRVNHVKHHKMMWSYLYRDIEKVSLLKHSGKLYDIENNSDIMKISFCEYLENIEEKVSNNIDVSDIHDKSYVESEDFISQFKKAYYEIKSFMNMLEIELELHNDLRSSKIILAHSLEMLIILSITASTIDIL